VNESDWDAVLDELARLHRRDERVQAMLDVAIRFAQAGKPIDAATLQTIRDAMGGAS
jgi:hypothetical protein